MGDEKLSGKHMAQRALRIWRVSRRSILLNIASSITEAGGLFASK